MYFPNQIQPLLEINLQSVARDLLAVNEYKTLISHIYTSIANTTENIAELQGVRKFIEYIEAYAEYGGDVD